MYFADATPLEQEIAWIAEIVIGVALLICASFGVKHLLKYLRRRLLGLSPEWREKIDYIVLPPFKLFLWSVGILYGIEIIARRIQFTAVSGHVTPLRNIALTISITWLVLRWKNVFQQAYCAKSSQGILGVDRGIIHALGRLFGVIVFLLAGMAILQILGISILPLVAFGGIGAAAVGFAAKDMIANFFGGFMLYVNQPFMIGDFILLPEKNIEGHVEEIGWYLTSIRDKEKRPLYIPNNMFSNQFVVNASRMSHRRIRDLISIRAEDVDKLPMVVSEIKKIFEANPYIDKNLPILVFFEGFKDFSVGILIDAYCLLTREDAYLALKQSIFLEIEKTLALHEVAMPLPTSLHIVRQENAGI